MEEKYSEILKPLLKKIYELKKKHTQKRKERKMSLT
jgi:hypothetical protein